MNTKQILYYSDAICQKIDLRVDAFLKRIESLRHGDTEHAEYIEMMMIEPLDKQIEYLTNKISALGKEKKHG